jgi:predicted RNase H-like nuclease
LESADIVYFLSGYAETLNQISPSDPPLGLEVETVIFAARAVVAALAADDALDAAAVALAAAAAASASAADI